MKLGLGLGLQKERSNQIWTPSDLTNLFILFDLNYGLYSDAGITPAVGGDTIYRWVARYPTDGSVYAQQTTSAARPTLSVGANGQQYLTFTSGNNKHLAISGSSSWFSQHANVTFFSQCKRNATGSYMSMFSSDDNAGLSGAGLAFSPGTAYIAYGGSYRNMDQSTSVWCRYAGKWLWDGTKNVGTPYYNGVVSNGASYNFTSNFLSNGNMTIGARTGGNNPFIGNIGGVLGIILGQIPDEEMALLDEYQITRTPT